MLAVLSSRPPLDAHQAIQSSAFRMAVGRLLPREAQMLACMPACLAVCLPAFLYCLLVDYTRGVFSTNDDAAVACPTGLYASCLSAFPTDGGPSVIYHFSLSRPLRPC